MSSRERHLQHLLEEAVRKRNEATLASAFTLIQQHFDEIQEPHVLVRFAEAASYLEKEDWVERVLQLLDRLDAQRGLEAQGGLENNQFKARMLLIRCLHEARSGIGKLYGENLVQQIEYALTFLQQAREIAAETQNKDRYGFLVYNATLVFWIVARPICRPGWQQKLVKEFQQLYELLKQAPTAQHMPCPVDVAWRIEFGLQYAFALEDAGQDAEASKVVEQELTSFYKAESAHAEKYPWLYDLLTTARAWFARKNSGNIGTVRKDLEGSVVSKAKATVLFARNDGLAADREKELVTAWCELDNGFRAVLDGNTTEETRTNITPESQAVMASASRAACQGELWPLALKMVDRLMSFRAPPPKVRVLIDLSRAETNVWRACNEVQTDPSTDMLLTKPKQKQREIDARVAAVRLCEQCIMAAKRIEDVDLVEESAIIMWNYAIPLLSVLHRSSVHKSLLKTAEILNEIDSNLMQLRVQLHLEVAKCEVANDLLTKGKQELCSAQALDNTLTVDQLQPERRPKPEEDPAPYTRAVNHYEVDPMQTLLRWKLSLYEEPDDPTDQAMLLIDQVRQQRSEESRELGFNLLSQACEKLEAHVATCEAQLPKLSDEFAWPAMHVTGHAPLEPLPNKAARTVREKECDPKAIDDLRPKSDRELAIVSLKRCAELLCVLSKEAVRLRYTELAIQAADTARAVITTEHAALEPPVDQETAIHMAVADYVKAESLAKQLDSYDVVAGVNEPEAEERKGKRDPHEVDTESELRRLTPKEREKVIAAKEGVITSLLLGMQIAHRFGQPWLLHNGLALFWNIHRDLVMENLFDQALLSYHQALEESFDYLFTLPPADFDHDLALDLTLALLQSLVARERVDDIPSFLCQPRNGGTHALLALLDRLQAKEVAAEMTRILRGEGKPVPELPKSKEDDPVGSGGGAAAGGKPPAKGAAPAKGEAGALSVRVEAEVMKLVESIPTEAEDKRLGIAKEAADKLDAVASLVNDKDEEMVILFIDMWSTLGRHILAQLETSQGAKFALMAAHKALGGQLDTPMPPNTRHSTRRLLVLGAAHQLAGRALLALVDPKRQERGSQTRLRDLAVQQFERVCEYARVTKRTDLAECGARLMWNAAMPLLDSADTRPALVQPLLTATSALAECKFKGDPDFIISVYTGLFECYSAQDAWDSVQRMLNEAFTVVPSRSHRKLWALRMLALSRQGRDVVVAMGKMKETQANAQANIWMVLAHAAARREDQLRAYQKASEILQGAQQAKVVEVRMETADWMLRCQLPSADALDQLQAAADFLLDIEEENAEMNSPEGGGGESRSVLSRRSLRSGKSSSRGSGNREGSQKSRRSGGSRRSMRSGGSRRSSAKTGTAKSSKAQSTSTRSRAKAVVEENDADMPSVLSAQHYEQLMRIYAMMSATAQSGDDQQRALLSAVHFATKMVSATVHVANLCAHQLAEHAGDTKNTSETTRVSPFRVPTSLVDWVPEARPLPPELFTLLQQAQQTLPEGVGTYIGSPGCFLRPALTLHLLDYLETRLELHGYHPWVLPVLAVHREFVRAVFPSLDEAGDEKGTAKSGQSTGPAPLHDTALAMVDLRLARIAHVCNLPDTARAAWQRVEALLPDLPKSFHAFEEELEQARVLRGTARKGIWTNDAKEVDAGRGILNPFVVNELRPHEIWTPLAEELFARGENNLCGTFVAEALRHARVYDDLRTVRRLSLLSAKLGRAEGDAHAVLKACGQIDHAEPLETVDMAELLIGAYGQLNSPVLVEQVLQEAQHATRLVAAGAGRRRGNRGRSSQTQDVPAGLDLLLAECRIELLAIGRQREMVETLPLTSREFKPSLQQYFEKQLAMLSNLKQQGFHWQLVTVAVHLFESFITLTVSLERALLELLAKNASVMPFEELHGLLMEPAARMLAEARKSRDALTTLCAEAGGHINPPALRLVVQFDILRADVQRCGARLLAANARVKAQKAAAQSGSPLAIEVLEDPPEPTPLEQWLAAEEATHVGVERFYAGARSLGEASERAVALSESSAALTDLVGPKAKAEALRAVGAAHLECAYAAEQVKDQDLWTPFILHEREKREMYREELRSNLLNERNIRGNTPPPADPADPADPDAEPPKEPPPPAPRPRGVPPPPKTDFLDSARQKLEEVVDVALPLDVDLAYRAAKPLATEAYGLLDPPKAFAALLLHQSLAVCKKGKTTLGVVAPSHHEAVLYAELARLEATWPNPQDLRSYVQLQEQLETMPLQQRMRLEGLAPVPELLVEYLPPKTLVVSLQVIDGTLYVAAAMTPPAGGDAEEIKYCVRRFQFSEVALVARCRRLSELSTEVEKDFVVREEMTDELAARAMEVQREAELLLAGAFKLLDFEFFLLDCPSAQIEQLAGGEDPDPQRVLFLPDAALWSLPLEQFSFGRRFPAASRDLSFHLFCQRAVAAQAPSRGPIVPAFPASMVRLMTDPFNEDVVPVGSMHSLHERLIQEKVVAGGHSGGQWLAEPADFLSTFQEANAFLFLGFGRFVGGIGLQEFCSADLRNLQAMVLISHAVNDASFRRQTKTDSNKTPAEVELESPYMTAVFASFRGSGCLLQMSHPIPIPLAIRALDHIARQLANGDALDAVVRGLKELRTPPGMRYDRAALSGQEVSPKKSKGEKKDKKATPEPVSPQPEPQDQALFPAHCLTAFQLIGLFGVAKKP